MNGHKNLYFLKLVGRAGRGKLAAKKLKKYKFLFFLNIFFLRAGRGKIGGKRN